VRLTPSLGKTQAGPESARPAGRNVTHERRWLAVVGVTVACFPVAYGLSQLCASAITFILILLGLLAIAVVIDMAILGRG
jgi:hypothetical protein